jgi:hypothetical protein
MVEPVEIIEPRGFSDFDSDLAARAARAGPAPASPYGIVEPDRSILKCDQT